MRQVLVLLAAVVVLGLLLPGRAGAGLLGSAAAVQSGADPGQLYDKAAYLCRRTWRCGVRSCGWRNLCHWSPRPLTWVPYPYRYRKYWGYPRLGERPDWRGRYRRWR